MNEPTIDLEKRLGRLERENHRLKQLAGLVLLAMAALTLMGQAAGRKLPRVVEAGRFILRDANGRERGSFEVDERFGVILRLSNAQGVGQVTLGTGDNMPFLGLTSPNRKKQAVFTTEVVGLSDNKKPIVALGQDGLTLFAEDEKQMRVTPVGIALIEEKAPNEEEKLIFSLTNTKEGSALLLKALKRKEGLTLMATEKFTGALVSDSSGKNRAALNLGNDGEPSLTLSDRDGKSRAVLGSTSLEATKTGSVRRLAESSLVLFDKEGKVIWSAP